jgi:myo-inositol-1(or 4)-monophosphatase
VACGRYDGYWELKLHPWDVAAGILIVEEAGGRVTDLAGGPAPASGREIASSNGRIHDELLRVLAGR